jgi:two-component system cell cycle sensor histidine kinase/response regulator CckA
VAINLVPPPTDGVLEAPGRERHPPPASRVGRLAAFGHHVGELVRRRGADQDRSGTEPSGCVYLAGALDGVVLADERGRVLEWNPGAERIFGYERREALDREIAELVIPERDRAMHRQAFARYAESGETAIAGRCVELVARRASGEEFPVEVTLCPVEVKPFRVLGVVRDVTKEKQEEAALRARKRDWRALFEANPNAMWVHDCETLRFLAVNETACRQYGWSRQEFLAMSVTDLGAAEDETQRQASVTAGGEGFTPPELVRHMHQDGTTLDIEVSAHALVFEDRPAQLVLAHDVSQRRRLEETLARAVKMEALGRLAGGVAHDFNNVLVVVTGYADLIARRTDDAAILDAVQAMKTAGERAAGLTRQLAAVSRRQALVPKPLSLNEVVRGLRPLFTQLLGADIALEFSLAREAPTVLADPSQLEQVVLNLVVNARDAMPHGGRLAIETQTHSLLGRLADERFDLAPGRYAVLQVSDTGIGMDRETMARMFEPFFTTKSEATGTGLGLATVYGIVTQSGGDVWVYSEPGEGTVLKIYLPEAPGEADSETTDVHSEARSRGEGTILLVEDDEAVRGLVETALAEDGYTIESAGDAEGALAVLARRPVDLLVTDVVMPGQSGRVLADEVRVRSPQTKVLFISGYAGDALMARGVAEDLAFLSKPFDIDELAMQVRKALSRA